MRNFISLILVFVATLSIAQNENFEAELQVFYSNLKSLSASFSQEKTNPILNEPLRSEGEFYYLNPGSIRWETASPNSTCFIRHNGESFILENNKKKKADRIQSLIFERFISKTLTGEIINDPQLKREVTFQKEEVLITLEPVSSKLKKYFLNIELYFSKEDKTLNKMRFDDGSGTIITLTFSNQKVNTELNPELFQAI